MLDSTELTELWNRVFADLFSKQGETAGNRFWTGRLCSSVVSTATAVSCLTLIKRNLPELYIRCNGFVTSPETPNVDALLARSLDYLLSQQNPDGGWGDTSKSYSNLAASWLAVSAALLNQESLNPQQVTQLERGRQYLTDQGRIQGLERRYGKDKTFAVPILVNAALAGDVSWSAIPSLPFELACIPHKWLGIIRLPVVSYAIPALVAIGLALHFHRSGPSVWPLAPFRAFRRLFAVGSLNVCRSKQPASGGFLEAAPLTAFVGMSLASIKDKRICEHSIPIIEDAARFLLQTVRPDGSWPIDTNLAHWLTTLSGLAASAYSQERNRVLKSGDIDLNWILSNQNRKPHPFTQTAPGGWGWTNLSGSVPDADDTPGTLLLLDRFYRCRPDEKVRQAAQNGIGWLLDLQNSDGGWPTFCRGWGTLPFDRSGVDLTAHAVRALTCWRPAFDALSSRIESAVHRGIKYIVNNQRPDGSWVPLWFGNQDDPKEENPIYGTVKALAAFRDRDRQTGSQTLSEEYCLRAFGFLTRQQNPDGSFGTGGIEESALATEILFADKQYLDCAEKGIRWLGERIRDNSYQNAAPIGLYFAKLWYYEDLYPLIYTLFALSEARNAGFDEA